jgi:hypothetical protein
MLKNSTFCPCLLWILGKTVFISLFCIWWLVFVTETECVYCAVLPESLNIIQSFKDHAMDQAVSRWPFTVEPRIRFQMTPYEMREGQSVMGADFSLSLSVSPRQLHFTSAAFPSSSTCFSYQAKGWRWRGGGETPERVKNQWFFGNRRTLDIQCSH